MALTKTVRLTDLGMDDVKTKLYINISGIALQFRPEGIMLHASLNIFANEQARRDGRNVIGQESVSGLYDPILKENIHTAVYNLTKTHPQFADAEDA